MILWCMITIHLSHVNPNHPFIAETAAHGTVLNVAETHYIVDFSAYAKKQGYDGDYSRVIVDKEKCMEEIK